MLGKNYLLWENDTFIVKTPFNPHLSYTEGIHVIVAPKSDETSAWENPNLAGDAFALAAKVSNVIVKLGLAPWLNLQANGNWGLLPGATPFFHIHIYGRNKTASWGEPVELPKTPGTFNFAPMPEQDRELLSTELRKSL